MSRLNYAFIIFLLRSTLVVTFLGNKIYKAKDVATIYPLERMLDLAFILPCFFVISRFSWIETGFHPV